MIVKRQGDAEAATHFLNNVMDNYWHQHIEDPTRARGENNPSILDLVFTNEQDMISEITYNSPLGKSDHSTINFKYLAYTETLNYSQDIYIYNKGNYEGIKQDLSIDWGAELKDLTPEEQWQKIKSALEKSMEKIYRRGR